MAWITGCSITLNFWQCSVYFTYTPFILCLIFSHSGRTKFIDCAYYDLMFKEGRNRDYFNIRQITAGLGWHLQTLHGGACQARLHSSYAGRYAVHRLLGPVSPNATDFMYSSVFSCIIGSNSEQVADSVETKK